MSEEQEKVIGGFYIPDTAQQKSKEALVISVGSEITNIKDGDTVILGRDEGDNVKVDGKSMKIVSYDNILAVK